MLFYAVSACERIRVHSRCVHSLLCEHVIKVNVDKPVRKVRLYSLTHAYNYYILLVSPRSAHGRARVMAAPHACTRHMRARVSGPMALLGDVQSGPGDVAGSRIDADRRKMETTAICQSSRFRKVSDESARSVLN